MRERPSRNGLNQILVMSAACVLFFAFFGYQVVSTQLFVPAEAGYEWNDPGIGKWENDEGQAVAYYFVPKAGARRTVFYLHDNKEDLESILPLLNNYSLFGYSVLSFDYRGFGLSEGTPSEAAVYADAAGLLDFLRKRSDVELGQVVLHGRGLGAGVAMELALREPVGGLVLERAYRSFYKTFLSLKWIPGDAFRNEDKAGGLKCPTLVLAFSEDSKVPASHAEAIAGEIPEGLGRRFDLEGTGEGSILERCDESYWAAIRGFINSLPSAN